jgi:hypothetical protein
VTLETVLRIARNTSDLEESKTIIHQIYKFSQETTTSRKLDHLRDTARDLGFDVDIDRRRKAVTLSRRDFARTASGRLGGVCNHVHN